jgi:hypothetical protein
MTNSRGVQAGHLVLFADVVHSMYIADRIHDSHNRRRRRLVTGRRQRLTLQDVRAAVSRLAAKTQRGTEVTLGTT